MNPYKSKGLSTNKNSITISLKDIIKDITKHFLRYSYKLIYDEIKKLNSPIKREVFSYIWAVIIIFYARNFIKSLDKNLSVSQKLIELWRNTFSIFQETLKIQSKLKILAVVAFLTIFLASLCLFLYEKSFIKNFTEEDLGKLKDSMNYNNKELLSLEQNRYIENMLLLILQEEFLPVIFRYNDIETDSFKKRKDNIKTKILNTLFATFFYCALPILGSCFSEKIGAICLGISLWFIISPIILSFCNALIGALNEVFQDDSMSQKDKDEFLFAKIALQGIFNLAPLITKCIFELLSNVILNIEEKFIEKPCGKLYNYVSELVFGQKQNQQVQPEI